MKHRTITRIACLFLTIICLYAYTLYQGVTAFALMDEPSVGTVGEAATESEIDINKLYTSDGTDYTKLEYSPLLNEVTELRGQYEKRFQREDRAYEAVMYSYPVHYDDNGTWKAIDNTLIADKDRDGNSIYRTSANDFTTSFAPAYADSQDLVKMTHKEHSIGFSFTDFGSRATASVDNNSYETAKTAEERDSQLRFPAELTSKITYPNVSAGTSLAYMVSPTGITELITIDKLENVKASYTSMLHVSKGLTAKLLDNGTVEFYSGDEVVFSINAPFMYDANGAECYGIDVTLVVNDTAESVNGTTYKYTIAPNMDWLRDAARVFPITIDPTVTTTHASANILDTHVASGSPTSNFYNSASLKVGHTSDTSKTCRIYLKLKNLPPMHSGDTVISSSLCMYRGETGYQNQQMNLYRVDNSWTSTGITWNNKPDPLSSDSPIKTVAFTNAAGYDSAWNITSLMKEWYIDSNTNNGVMIKNANESNENLNFFYSADCGENHEDAKPFVQIVYINTTGIEDMWSYHTQDVSNAGMGYVNDYNGNLTFTHDDGASTGGVLPASVSHVYNSNDRSTDIGYGYGWRINYAQTVQKVGVNYFGSTTYYYKHIDGDGTAQYYKKTSSSSSTYENEFDSSMKLTISGSTITITDKQDNKLVFICGVESPIHYLRYMRDANGNELEITYTSSNAISRVYDGVDNCFVFNYDANDRVSRIHVPGGQSVGYEYSSDGNLTTIKYFAKSDVYVSSSTYLYSSHYMLSATDNSGYKITYTYSSSAPKRVATVIASAGSTTGQSISFSYGWNKTLITDNQNRTIMYQFNNLGQAISVRDVDGSAQYCSFNDAVGKCAQLKSVSKLQKTVVNMITNPNADRNALWSRTSNIAREYVTVPSFWGQKVIKIYGNATGSGRIVNDCQMIPGKTYTLSGYMCGNITGVKLLARYKTSSTTWAAIYSDTLSMSNDWNRYDFTFTIPSDAYGTLVCVGVYSDDVTAMTSTEPLYMDNFMLEETDSLNRYNLIENGDFSSGTSNWTLNNGTGTVMAATDNSHPAALSSSVYPIPGSISNPRNISQQISIKGGAGDCFTFGGWMYSDTIPEFEHNGVKYGEKKLVVQFYCDSTWKNGGSVSFNDDTKEWQYVCGAAVAPEEYTAVKFSAEYNHNCNYAYFDGMQLFFDEFAQSYTYDGDGNLLSVAALANQNSSFEYHENTNDLKKYTDPKGKSFTYTYDNKHNVKTATSATSIKYDFEYDIEVNGSTDFGKPIRTTFGKNGDYVGSRATYDSKGHMSSVIDARGKQTSYAYSSYEGLLSSVTDANGNVTTNTYDTQNRLSGITTDSSTVTYGYDTNSRLNRITRNGWYYAFTYDAFGNPYQTKVNSTTLITNTYSTSTGLLTSTAYGNGLNVTYVYDAMDRVTEVRHGGSLKFTYAYDGEGNLSYAEDKVTGISARYYYDTIGRLSRVDRSNSDGTFNSGSTYEHDKNNNISRVVNRCGVNSWATSYTYDGDNRLTVTGLNTGDKLHYTYTDVSTMGGRAYKTSGGTNIYSESFNHVDGQAISGVTGDAKTSLISGMTSSSGTILAYNYDNNGNITQIMDIAGSLLLNTYVYDAKNQLIRENNKVVNRTILYTYDSFGNMTQKRIYSFTNGTPTTLLDTINYTYRTSGWKDQLISYDGNTISYDANGNPTTYMDYIMQWSGRELSGIYDTTTSSFVSIYSYDDAGLRTRKSVIGTGLMKYTWDNGNLTSQTGTTANLYFSYDSNGQLVAMYRGGTIYYYMRNAQNDVIGLVDRNGSVVAKYSYDSWGKPVSITDGSGTDVSGNASHIANVNPFRYRGYYYDAETGLYYVSSRYYDPEIGRFISPEPNVDNGEFDEGSEILGYNVYAYCFNNPVNNADPDGEAVANIVGGIVGGVTGAALGYLLAQKLGLTGWKKWALISAATIGGAALGAFLGPYVAKLAKSIGSAVKSTVKTVVKRAPKSLCFVAGTLVEAQDGYIPIEKIKTGDYVYAEDPETGEKGLKQVVQTFVNQTYDLVHVKVDGQKISATPNHPFYSPEKGWVEAIELRAGDKLVLRSGKIVFVEGVQHEILEFPVTVYNFEVEDFHTYYVTSSSVLVHNLCAKEFIKSPKNAKQVLSYLKDQGFKAVSQNGSHIKLVNGSKTVIVPNHGGKDIAMGTLKSIMKQAGLL